MSNCIIYEPSSRMCELGTRGCIVRHAETTFSDHEEGDEIFIYSPISFSTSSIESKTIQQWMDSHECSVTYVGAIGGKYSFTFTPTSVGTTIVVKCTCGAEINATDYDSW